MAVIVYGTHVFTKFKGYYGVSRECPHCSKVYKPSYVKYSTWAHLEYIPLFPVKIRYTVTCPVCGYGIELKSKEAKVQMQEAKDERQQLEVFARRVVSRKPITFDVFVKDLNTNEETRVEYGVTKAEVKQIKKARGLKKLQIMDVKEMA